MAVEVIVAVITTAGGIITAIIISAKNTQKKYDELHQEQKSLIEYKIADLKDDFSKLETDVKRHNGFMERIAKVESSAKNAHHRISELKDEMKNEKTF